MQFHDAEWKSALTRHDNPEILGGHLLKVERTHRPPHRHRADGKDLVDDFDVEVRNRSLDRTYLMEELSGGQFVLVNEAVNLGIAIYNMRQGKGIRYETLFRDETVGALDAANGKEYVRTRSSPHITK
jgi:hypothetical protein